MPLRCPDPRRRLAPGLTLASALLAAVGGACTRSGADAPVHAGKPLATWVDELDDREAAVRLLAADALGRFDPQVVRPHVEKLARVLRRDPDAGARRSAAGALGRLRAATPEALDALGAALDDPSSGVRAWAARALGAIGAPASPLVPQLERLTADPSFDVRTAAADALDDLRGPARPPTGSRAPPAPARAEPPADVERRLGELGYDAAHGTTNEPSMR